MRAELLHRYDGLLAEGPVWDHRRQRLHWVDIRNGELLSSDLAVIVDRVAIGVPVGAVALGADDALVVAASDGFHRVSASGSVERLYAHDLGASDLRMNDGKPDPEGRFVVGSMADPPRHAAGTLWAFDGDSVEPVLTGLTISNGLAWDATGTVLYHVDTPTQRVAAYAYESGATLGFGRPVVEIPASVGAPDGMTIDSEGGLWVALWGGSAVHCYRDGTLDAIVEVPARLVTSVTFAGPELDHLVITTADDDQTAEHGTSSVFVCQPGVVGCAGHPLSFP